MTKQTKIKNKNSLGMGWDIWEKNFFNAKRFFRSKGNKNTRSRLKDKWFKGFKEDLEKVELLTLKNGGCF